MTHRHERSDVPTAPSSQGTLAGSGRAAARRHRALVAAALLAGLALLLAACARESAGGADDAYLPSTQLPQLERTAELDAAGVLRINAGGPALELGGVNWHTDQHFVGGKSYANTDIVDVMATDLDELYRTEHSATTNLGGFSYEIPVPDGRYDVHLHFAEIYWGATGTAPGGAGDRIFTVDLENVPAELVDYDINADVGPQTAVIKTYQVDVTDGTLDISFTATANRPKISAIELERVADASAPVGSWASRAPSGEPRQEVSYVQVGGRFYLAGDGTRHEVYDPATDAWTDLAPLPLDLDHVQAVALDGKVYYVGGLKAWPTPASGSVFVYDPASDTFSQAAPMPAGRERGGGGVAVYGGRIYYAGGMHAGQAVAWLDRYDPASDSWTQLADMPTPRDHFHAAVYDSVLYAIGGRDSGVSLSATTPVVEAYDLVSEAWSVVPTELPTQRGGFASAVVGNEILVIGGEGGGQTFDEVEAYDPAANSWRTLAPMPTPRHGIQAAVCAGGVYVAAGGSVQGGSQPTDVHEVLFLDGATSCDPTPIGDPPIGDPPPADATVIARINAGGGAITLGGIDWNADQHHDGGNTYRNDAIPDIQNTDHDELYRTERSATTNLGSFAYHIPVPASATYQVNLHFAEIYWNANCCIQPNTLTTLSTLDDPYIQNHALQPTATSGDRIFTVDLEDAPAELVDYDINADVGPQTAVIKTYQVDVTDGTLDITLTATANRPKISAIEILTSDDVAPEEPSEPLITAISWTGAAKAPIGRTEAQGAVVDGLLYTIGGYVSWQPFCTTSATHAYDPRTDAWTTLAPMPAEWSHGPTAVDGDLVHVAAGYANAPSCTRDEVATHAVWTYDTSADSWSDDVLPPLPLPRGSAGMVRLGRQLHVFGGTDSSPGRPDKGDHWVLSLDDPQEWVPLAPMPEPRNHLGSVAFDGKIYVFGGQYGYSSLADAVTYAHVYDPASDSWSETTPLPQPLSHITPSTFVVGGQILIMGGERAQGVHVADVLAYDPAAETYTALTPLPMPRNAGVAGVIDGVLYYTGGSNFAKNTYRGEPIY